MNTPILRTEKLKAYYVLDLHGTQKVVKAVNEVDIEIQENEVYGIAGESGCGKTTLLKTLVAAIEPPLRLVGGKVYYRVIDFEGIEIAAIGPLSPSDAEEDRWWTGGEVDVSSLTPETKRRLRWEYISYVPQGSMSVLNPVTKVKETYRDFIGSHTSGQIAKEEAFELAKEQITELGLPPKILDAYPHQLSGGMRQRVTIALAALLKPRIIVCDEPTTALDVVVQKGGRAAFKGCSSETEKHDHRGDPRYGHSGEHRRPGRHHVRRKDRRGVDDRDDLWQSGPSIHQVLDRLAAEVWGQDDARERARKPAFSCRPAQRLPLPPQVPLRPRHLCPTDARLYETGTKPQSCLLAGRRRKRWINFLKSII